MIIYHLMYNNLEFMKETRFFYKSTYINNYKKKLKDIMLLKNIKNLDLFF